MGTWYDSTWMRNAREGRGQGAKEKVDAIEAGLEGGMNFIDTAEIYQSEPLVGEAVKGRRREEVFIATKVWQNHLHREDLLLALEKSLQTKTTAWQAAVHDGFARLPGL